MKKMLFILNPCAGQRRAAKNLASIIEIFNRADYEVNVYLTSGSGDGEKMAALRGPECDLVVGCGGDGTFNETVAGLLKAGADVPVGYIPAGSTNDFANSLGLPLDNLQAAKDIVEGKGRRLDVGLFGDRYFSYVASFGAFTRASYATPQSLKNLMGHMAYILSGIAEIAQLKTEHVRIELADGQVMEDDYIFGAVSNSTSLAGVLTLAPDRVDMCDGKLEVMLLKAPKDLIELGEMVAELQKQTYNSKAITFFSAESMKISASDTMDWTLDGERQPGVSETEIRCVHKAVELVMGE